MFNVWKRYEFILSYIVKNSPCRDFFMSFAVMGGKCLMTESKNLAAERVGIEEEKIVVRGFLLRYCFYYLLGHHTTQNRTYRTHLRVEIAPVFGKVNK